MNAVSRIAGAVAVGLGGGGLYIRLNFTNLAQYWWSNNILIAAAVVGFIALVTKESEK